MVPHIFQGAEAKSFNALVKQRPASFAVASNTF